MKGVVRYFCSTEYTRLPAGRLRLNGLADNHCQPIADLVLHFKFCVLYVIPAMFAPECMPFRRMKSMRLITSSQSSVIQDAVKARNDSWFVEVHTLLAIGIFPRMACRYVKLFRCGPVPTDSNDTP